MGDGEAVFAKNGLTIRFWPEARQRVGPIASAGRLAALETLLALALIGEGHRLFLVFPCIMIVYERPDGTIIELPGGSAQTVKVAKHIDLDKLALADSVPIQLTEALAIEVSDRGELASSCAAVRIKVQRQLWSCTASRIEDER
jgi:hypothetical protein